MLAAAEDQDLAELRAALFRVARRVSRAAGIAGFDGLLDRGNRRGTQPVGRRGVDAAVPRPEAAAGVVRRRHQFGPRRMTDCVHYRRAILADPRDADPAARARIAKAALNAGRTRSGCCASSCASSALLRVSAPAQGTVWGVRRGWLAMAASVLIVLLVSASLWLAAPHSEFGCGRRGSYGGGAAGVGRAPKTVPPAELAPGAARCAHAAGSRRGHGELCQQLPLPRAHGAALGGPDRNGTYHGDGARA